MQFVKLNAFFIRDKAITTTSESGHGTESTDDEAAGFVGGCRHFFCELKTVLANIINDTEGSSYYS